MSRRVKDKRWSPAAGTEVLQDALNAKHLSRKMDDGNDLLLHSEQ